MVVGFFITYRETLEAALLIGIVVSYLYRTKNTKYLPAVWAGIAAGILLSIVAAFAFTFLVGEFAGPAEQVFEGTVLALAAVLITTLVLWLMGHTTARRIIERHVSREVHSRHMFGLGLLVATSIIREGVETVIFLGASTLAVGSSANLFLGALGVAAAIATAAVFFRGARNVPLKLFFNITTIVLVIFGAGIVSLSVHEFQEAGVLPQTASAWNINPPINPNGTYPLWHDHGLIGGSLRELFGYSGNPNWLEVIGYFGYLGIVAWSWLHLRRQRARSEG